MRVPTRIVRSPPALTGAALARVPAALSCALPLARISPCNCKLPRASTLTLPLVEAADKKVSPPVALIAFSALSLPDALNMRPALALITSRDSIAAALTKSRPALRSTRPAAEMAPFNLASVPAPAVSEPAATLTGPLTRSAPSRAFSTMLPSALISALAVASFCAPTLILPPASSAPSTVTLLACEITFASPIALTPFTRKLCCASSVALPPEERSPPMSIAPWAATCTSPRAVTAPAPRTSVTACRAILPLDSIGASLTIPAMFVVSVRSRNALIPPLACKAPAVAVNAPRADVAPPRVASAPACRSMLPPASSAPPVVSALPALKLASLAMLMLPPVASAPSCARNAALPATCTAPLTFA